MFNNGIFQPGERVAIFTDLTLSGRRFQAEGTFMGYDQITHSGIVKMTTVPTVNILRRYDFTDKEKTKTMRDVFEGMSELKKEVAYWLIGKAAETSFWPPVMTRVDKAIWETFTKDEKNVVYAIIADAKKPAWKPLTSSDLAMFADFAADIHRKKEHNEMKLPEIKNAYFNCPVTVVMWKDGTKTIVRCSENDAYDPEKGLAMAIIKKVSGNDNSFHKIFKKWIREV